MPFFSIIIPTFNRAATLQRSIDSILENQQSDYEIIVVDDGSTDDTENVIRKISCDRLLYHRQDNQGVCVARNKGVELSNGRYLIFLDSDDSMVPGTIDSYQNIITELQPDIIFSNMIIIDEASGKETFVSARNPYGNVISSGIFIPGTFCISRELFDNSGQYDALMKYGENTELKFRIEKLNPSVAFTDKVSILYYQSLNGESKNIANLVSSNIYMLKKHKELFERFPAMEKNYRQAIAIAQFKLGELDQARAQMWKAYICQPFKMKALLRFILLLMPSIAGRIWK